MSRQISIPNCKFIFFFMKLIDIYVKIRGDTIL